MSDNVDVWASRGAKVSPPEIHCSAIFEPYFIEDLISFVPSNITCVVFHYVLDCSLSAVELGVVRILFVRDVHPDLVALGESLHG